MDIIKDFLNPIAAGDFETLGSSLDRLAADPDEKLDGYLRHIVKEIEKDPAHNAANTRVAEGYRHIKVHFARVAIRSITARKPC